MTRRKPAPAQFEPILQLLTVIQGIISLLEDAGKKNDG